MEVKITNLNIEVNDKNIFKDFNFFAEENKITGISAPSGFGKTTLLNWIAGVLSEDFTYSPYCDFGKISYVFQEPELIPDLSVLENIILPVQKIYGKKISVVKAIEILKQMELLEKKDSLPEKLSGGEKQRASIARALIFPADIMLLDEPFQSLDKEIKFDILGNIKNYLKEKPETVIFVSHNREELDFLCDKVCFFSLK